MARTKYRVADGGLLEIFSLNNTYRGIFSTNSSGEVQLNATGALSLSNGARTIKSNTGDLNIITDGADGNIILTPDGSGKVSVNYLTNTKVVFTDASNYLTSTGTVAVAQGGTGATSFTAGSIIFSNGTILTQDNSNLFWDDTNNRLGIGTTSPLNSIHINTAATPAKSHFKTTANAAGALSLNTYAVDNSWVGFDVDYDSAYIARHTSASLILKTSNNLSFYADTSLTSGNSFTPTLRWSILGASGILQSSGAQTIQTSTGKLTISTAAGNGDIVLVPHGSGKVGIANSSPTVALDVTGEGKFSSYVTGVTPLLDAHLATKGYADSISVGYTIHTACRVATTTALAATYNSGAKTYTATGNGAISLDSISLSLNDRVLIKDQSTQSENGLAYVSTVGDGSNPYVLTRSTDADTGAELVKAYVLVTAGTTNGGTSWVQTTPATITLDSTSIVWEKFFQATAYAAGNGIDITGATVSVKISGSTTYTANAIVFSDATTTLNQDANFLFDNDTDGMAIGYSSAPTDASLLVYRQGAKTASNYGINLQNVATSSTNSVNKIGLLITNSGTWNGSGSVNYGIYLNDVSGGTTNWAFYNNSGANLYLGASNVSIGTTSTPSRLTVRGSAGLLDIGDNANASLEVLSSISQNYTGSGNSYGLYIDRYQQTNANVNTTFGLYSVAGGINLGVNTLSSAVGIYANAYQSGTGTVTNAYSVYAATPTGTVTNKWNFYASGTAYNYFGGYVGISTTTPVSPLSVGSSSNFQVDSNGRVKLNATAPAFGTFVLDFSDSTSFSTSSTIYGINGRIINSGTGITYGGLLIGATTYGGAVSALYGVAGSTLVSNAAAAVTSSYSLFSKAPTINSGVITTAYGLYLEAHKITGVTTGYGVYQAGASDINYFAGNTGFGFTSSAGKVSIDGGLHVGGTTDAGDNNLLVDGGVRIGGSAVGNETLTVYKAATYSSETEASIYIHSTSNDSALLIGADAGNNISYIQSRQHLLDWTNRPLILQPNGGLVGIGIVTATSKLHLAAGTTTLAPLKLTSGSLLSSTEAGAIEYDGTDLYISNASGRYPLTRGVLGGTGTANYFPIWNTGGNSFVNSIVSQSSSGVTVTLAQNASTTVAVTNTSTSTAPLAGFVANSDAGQTSLYIYGSNHSTYADTAILSAASTVSNGLIINTGTTAPIRFFVNGSEAGRFHSDGNFGIGLTPTQKFQVYTTTSNLGFSHTDGTVNLSSYIGTSGGAVTLGGYLGTSTNHPLYFNTNSSAPQMVLTTSGYLGVGVYVPSQRVDVSGNIRATGDDARLLLRNAASVQASWASEATSGDMHWKNDGGAAIHSINQDGTVGIGLTTATAYLHLKAGTATASTAPIKLTSGVNLTSPEAGALEFSSSILYFTPASTRRKIVLEDSGSYSISVTGSAASVANALSLSSAFAYNSGTTFDGSAARTLQLSTVALASGGTNNTSYTTSGGFIYYDGSKLIDNSILRISGTDIGIGQSPTHKLDIYGTGAGTGAMISQYNSGVNRFAYLGFSSNDGGALEPRAFLGSYDSGDASANALRFVVGNNVAVTDLSTPTMTLTTDGLGIGVTSPTAYLNLKAGVAAASGAPLKFTSGTNLSSPEAGALEFSSNILYFTPTSSRYSVVIADSGTYAINVSGAAASVTNALSVSTPLAFTSGSTFNGSAARTLEIGTIPINKGGSNNTSYTSTNGILLYDGSKFANNADLIYNSGLGIGVGASPSAYLHIKAGTATASTAPIKLTTGVNLSSAETGALEFSSNILYFTPSSTRRKIVLEDSSTYSISISGDAATCTTAAQTQAALSVSSPLSFSSGSTFNGNVARTIELSGTIPSANLSGSYTGITGLGTLTGLTINGALSVSSSGASNITLASSSISSTPTYPFSIVVSSVQRFNVTSSGFGGTWASGSYGSPDSGWGSPSSGSKSLSRDGSATAANCADVLAELIIRLKSLGFLGA